MHIKKFCPKKRSIRTYLKGKKWKKLLNISRNGFLKTDLRFSLQFENFMLHIEIMKLCQNQWSNETSGWEQYLYCKALWTILTAIQLEDFLTPHFGGFLLPYHSQISAVIITHIIRKHIYTILNSPQVPIPSVHGIPPTWNFVCLLLPIWATSMNSSPGMLCDIVLNSADEILSIWGWNLADW